MSYNVIAPSALRTTSAGAGLSTVTVPKAAFLRAELDVTASAVPTSLNVKIQHSIDGGTTWYDLKAFAQIGAVATGRESIEISPPTTGLLRAFYAIVGTSYTFSVALHVITL